MKKATLIRNLQTVADCITQLDLPADIHEIHAFGSILREKETPHDIDIVVLYTQTPLQKARWEVFEASFSDSYGSEHRLREIKSYLTPFQARGTPLCDAVKDEALSKVLHEHGIVPAWAGCFSWTEVLGYDPYGFDPELRKVLRKMIFGRLKGFQVKFVAGTTLPDGFIPHTVVKNHALAWSREKPDVGANILGRSIDEKTEHDVNEFEHFVETEIPRLKQEYLKAKGEAIQRLLTTNVRLGWVALENRHTQINMTGTESLKELGEKTEQARIQMKNYKHETDILELIAYHAGYPPEGYTTEERIAECVIQSSRSRGVPEDKAREILCLLGLPEERVVTIKKYGYGTRHELAKSDKEKARLLDEAKNEEQRARLLKPVIKTVRSLDRRAEVHLEPFEGQPKKLTILINVVIDQLSSEEREKIHEELQKKGFSVKEHPWYISAIMSADLKGNENSRELQAIAKKMMIS